MTNPNTANKMPPREFTNIMADLCLTTTHTYRTSKEWRIFVAGYNAAVQHANDSIKAKYNMGQIAERLFTN